VEVGAGVDPGLSVVGVAAGKTLISKGYSVMVFGFDLCPPEVVKKFGRRLEGFVSLSRTKVVCH